MSPSRATWNPNSSISGPDDEPEPVADQVERAERAEDGQDVGGARGDRPARDEAHGDDPASTEQTRNRHDRA